MSSSIVAITEKNIALLAEAAAKFGMPRSEGWLRRCMFDPTVEDLVQDPVRGHMAVDENGEVVAVQGYYYQPCYYKQTKVIGNTGCIMGADAKCGENLICVLDKNKETRKRGVVGFGNAIANQRSAKVNKVFSRNAPAPYRPFEHRVGVADVAAYPIVVLHRYGVPLWIRDIVWFCCRPLSWLFRILSSPFVFRGGFKLEYSHTTNVEGLEDFWQRFLAANTGIISSREPARLRWLFEESMAAGKVHMALARKNGKLEGYVMIREKAKESFSTTWGKSFEIIDICAVKNDILCLKALASEALRLAGRYHGIKLVFYGYMPHQEQWLDDVLKIRMEDDHPYCMFGSCVPEVKESLLKNEGWFFGPFDGERCMGYGGYIDL